MVGSVGLREIESTGGRSDRHPDRQASILHSLNSIPRLGCTVSCRRSNRRMEHFKRSRSCSTGQTFVCHITFQEPGISPIAACCGFAFHTGRNGELQKLNFCARPTLSVPCDRIGNVVLSALPCNGNPLRRSLYSGIEAAYRWNAKDTKKDSGLRSGQSYLRCNIERREPSEFR